MFVSLKKGGFLRLFLLLSCWAMPGVAVCQPTVDESAFRALSDAGRYRFVHDFPFDKMDSIELANDFPRLLKIADEKGDRRSSIALRFYRFKERVKLKLPADEILSMLQKMENEAREEGFDVEQAVAHHYLIFEKYNQKRASHGQLYAGILEEMERMKAIGFEKMADYNIARLLFHNGSFMYNLEDFEKALACLTVAEPFLDPNRGGMGTVVLVLNHIQSIHQRQKNHPKGIEYARRILDFIRSYQPVDSSEQKNCRIWQGIASIDIASMLVGEQKFAEGEKWANEGYELVRASSPSGYQAEFDALNVLVPTKLELGKMDDAARLLKRMERIRPTDPKDAFFLSRNAVFYETHARFEEKKGNLAAAMHYLNLAKPLRDSLNRRNDARKLEQIKQRLDAQKYGEQIRLVEHEKELQTWLRNAAFLILLLVLALAWGIFRRLRNRRRQALADLEVARRELEMFTAGFREKSELAENLRLEMDKLAQSGERSEYLEKLTGSVILTENDWLQFRSLFEKVHPQFIAEQKALFPDLTPAETRLVVLEKLQLSTQEIATILGVSKNTVNQTRVRLRRKTGQGLT